MSSIARPTRQSRKPKGSSFTRDRTEPGASAAREVGWAGGKRVFENGPGCEEDALDSSCWESCAYSPELKVSLIYKAEGDLFTGILLDDTTGASQPGGRKVMFSPDRR